MDFDFKPYFERYEKLVAAVNAAFDKVKDQYPECVECKPHCDDCCHALFDLTLIEALYVNYHFSQRFSGEEKEKLLEEANKADRKVYKLKRAAYKAHQDGKDEVEILTDMARERVRCPLLNGEKMCELYEYRPITCRLYGIPTAIGGKAHTCGISKFAQGESYPTVNMDAIQQKLYDLSAELVRDLKSKHVRMADVIVPLSMALITEYSDEYLGVGESKEAAADSKGGKDG